MFVSGNAANAVALFNTLLTELTTNAALTGAAPSQAWVNVWQHAAGAQSGVVLRGPGLSNGDQIYIGMKLDISTPGDSYELTLYGMAGVIPSALTLLQHINVSSPVSCFLDVNTMPYWIVASGRRFVLVARMSTVYESLYGGLFLPYGDPTQYPYPLAVGGSTSGVNEDVFRLNTWRDVGEGHHHFPCGNMTSSGFAQAYPPLTILNPLGEWEWCSGTLDDIDADVVIAPRNFGREPDGFQLQGGLSSAGEIMPYAYMREQQGPCFDGSYALTPFTLLQHNPTSQVYGVLDGCFNCPGQGVAAEYIIQVSGVDHLVVQDVYRTATGDYWALKLS